jgi:DNA-binding IclR family transcriptional regulator
VPEAPKRSYNIAALQRGLHLLQLVSESPHGLTAKQFGSRSRLPVSTVHRFLANLEGASFLNRGGDSVYHLGFAGFAVGQAAIGQLDIRRVSLPYLQEFNRQTSETIHLRVQKNGYACDLEEHELRIRCVAAPIWDHAGSVNASLSITAPILRMKVMRLRQLAPLIRTAGLQISRELGYQANANRPLPRRSSSGEAARAQPL